MTGRLEQDGASQRLHLWSTFEDANVIAGLVKGQRSRKSTRPCPHYCNAFTSYTLQFILRRKICLAKGTKSAVGTLSMIYVRFDNAKGQTKRFLDCGLQGLGIGP